MKWEDLDIGIMAKIKYVTTYNERAIISDGEWAYMHGAHSVFQADGNARDRIELEVFFKIQYIDPIYFDRPEFVAVSLFNEGGIKGNEHLPHNWIFT